MSDEKEEKAVSDKQLTADKEEETEKDLEDKSQNSEEEVDDKEQKTEEKKPGVSNQEPEEKEEVEEKEKKKELPNFRVGDTVKVMVRIKEGDKERLQPFEGIVIVKKGRGISKTFTVRKIGVHGIGVERIWPLNSPNIESLKIIKAGKVRQAKLYYLRKKIGKEALKVKVRAAK